MSNVDFWNNRYNSHKYAYGVEPNVFFKEWLDKLKPGRIFLPAEGEGRNAVYAAKTGWNVFAFDNSLEARKKALNLALLNDVQLNYECCEYHDLKLQESMFDAIGLIFVHFAGINRKTFHKDLISLLKPGAYIILEGFSKKQLEYQSKFNSGGPSSQEMLFSLDDIRDDFSTLKLINLSETEVELGEGIYHNGLASVIRYVGKKV